jgi:2,4-dienoyl-CoA reductase-like NADH-dependent reductase (Old Yellow Enzyme family)
MQEYVNWITNNWSEILQIVLQVIGAASIIVRLTPTEADNKALDKVIKVLQALSLYKATASKKKK